MTSLLKGMLAIMVLLTFSANGPANLLSTLKGVKMELDIWTIE